MFNSLKRKKVIYDDYWIQKIELKKVNKRIDYFSSLCNNKTVLHFGCTDYPIFRPSNNLHIQLSTLTKKLHGFDIDLIGIEVLRKHVNEEYFSRYEDLHDQYYDICLIPETIEHVDNIKEFLSNLKYINATTFVITGPNCFSKEHIERNSFANHQFTEIVHPDHNCWFSPYTLRNVIEKYSDLAVKQVFLLENDTMVCCEAVRKNM